MVGRAGAICKPAAAEFYLEPVCLLVSHIREHAGRQRSRVARIVRSSSAIAKQNYIPGQSMRFPQLTKGTWD